MKKYQVVLLDGKGNKMEEFFAYTETKESAYLIAIREKKNIHAYDYIVVTWFD